MQLKLLLKKIKATLLNKDMVNKSLLNADITSATIDSRKVNKKSIFVACKGATEQSKNGYDFIKQALLNGAAGILVENGFNFQEKINRPVFLTKNARVAAAKMSEHLNDSPSKKIKIIGITGTNGKTSVSILLSAIINKMKKKSAVIGTLGTGHISKKLSKSNKTTPESEELSKILKNMVKKNFSHVCMEVSSHALFLHKVDGIAFQAAAFTNLSQDHFDFHINMENYREAKERLFTQILRKKGIAVLEKNNPLIEKIEKKNKIITWGTKKGSDVLLLRARRIGWKTEIIVAIMNEICNIKSNLIGDFNIKNILCAAAIAKSLGANAADIKKGIASVKSIKGRLERINKDKKTKKPLVFIDFAHTPDALKKTLEALNSSGKKILVFGCGGNRDEKKRPLMGKIASDFADYTIITSDNPRNENSKLILNDIAKGFCEKKRNFEIVENRKSAIKKSIKIAKIEDLVIIAGKGHEETQEIKNKKIYFSDKKQAALELKKWKQH